MDARGDIDNRRESVGTNFLRLVVRSTTRTKALPLRLWFCGRSRVLELTESGKGGFGSDVEQTVLSAAQDSR